MKNKTLSKMTLLVALMASSVQISAANASLGRNSTNFSNFNQIGNANWTSVGSEVQANQGNGFLVSQDAYDNFYLRLEFTAGAGTNSGIFIRCADSTAITDKSCYEINIFDTRPDQTYRTGAVTGYASPKTIINTEDNNWHTYEIYAIGEKIRVLLDGKETVYMRNPSRPSGHIALQLAQGAIKFRNLEIKPLRSNALNSSKTILDGVWELESMDIVDPRGNATPWCPGSFGVIMYTNNYMSTAVNCTSDPSKSVIYAGPFEIKDQTVFHHAQNYSSPSLNKVHSRTFKLKDKNHLELSGSLGENTVVVRWVRR